MPLGLILFLIAVIGLGVWQFGSLAPGTPDFPSDSVTAIFQGDYVAVYNPTNSIVDHFTLSVLRLSGTYTYSARNVRPRSMLRVSLRKLRTDAGKAYDSREDGECRMRMQWSIGGEGHDFSRYCRDY